MVLVTSSQVLERAEENIEPCLLSFQERSAVQIILALDWRLADTHSRNQLLTRCPNAAYEQDIKRSFPM